MVLNVKYDQIKFIAAPTQIGPIIRGFVDNLNKYGEIYGITNYLRLCHFVAQCAQECDHFNTLEEYASGVAYEGRTDLGNTHPGDGRRYKGRGYIQITGRANYISVGTKLGYDLVGHPELAETPEIAVLVALEYWKSRNLNIKADRDDIEGITRGVNGGLNGYAERKLFLSRAKTEFLKNPPFVNFTPEIDPVGPVVIAPPVVVKPQTSVFGWIVELLAALFKKG